MHKRDDTMINFKEPENSAIVISVKPNKITIQVEDLQSFKLADETLKVGSYLKITSNDSAVLMAIIENFSIGYDNNNQRIYLIEALPLGILDDGKFTRGGDSIAIPPRKVEPASIEDMKTIYQNFDPKKSFIFSKLTARKEIQVPVNGDSFFNKHIAIVGSTGSGKSSTLASIIQKTVNYNEKLKNNSHIIIFDIHSEYKTAFPNANFLDVNKLKLPYWLLNSEELEEILLDTGERDNYNQSSIFRKLVTFNKIKHNTERKKIYYDSPIKFEISEIENALFNLRNETKNYKNQNNYMIINDEYSLESGGNVKEESGVEFIDEEQRIEYYFNSKLKFHGVKSSHINKGTYADGTLDKFYIRFIEKIKQDRLDFMFGEDAKNSTFEDVLKMLLGYEDKKESNITIIDLSDVPFEVLSITVSLISRLIFEYGYIYKRLRHNKNPEELINNDAPILLVYEEAHKYVPNSDLVKFRASKKSIERIAKEGRKYGVTLLLSSQRPSEISETIFSQCNNFIAMRLTNPIDQNYVKKLLPDSLGSLIDTLPNLKQGEALLIGDSIILPSLVYIDECNPKPSSNDIPYWQLWKKDWVDLKFDEIVDEWHK